ncbi:hypothetical protein [Curtobacterium sp. 24E2]|nr:hypothetical protein JN350_10940 [Curtobacterium sp. 24E2]
MDAATRHLILEWLGAQDGVVESSGRLTHRDLMRVMVRSTAIDALNALPVERAAKALHVPASVCQQMIDSGHLWSYNLGSGPRIPTWQLTRRSSGAPAIPISEALPIVVAAIPAGESPAFIRHLMNVEHGALLDGDNQPVTPRRWLLAGLPPWPVVCILLSATGGDVEAAAASFMKE